MPNFAFPPAAARAEIPRPLPLQIVTSCPGPPEGQDWLHEVKHDGHRLLAIVAGGDITLISRNGYDRTALFRVLTDALRQRRPERLAYFAFDRASRKKLSP